MRTLSCAALLATTLAYFSLCTGSSYGSEKAGSIYPISKIINKDTLSKFKAIEVDVKDKSKRLRYKGVPLRAIFQDMAPEIKIDTMPDWKALSRKRLVMELTADDGYPGLVTAVELAINSSGDRFVLAEKCNGKDLDTGIMLVCKADEYHVRWVRQVKSARIVELAAPAP